MFLFASFGKEAVTLLRFRIVENSRCWKPA